MSLKSIYTKYLSPFKKKSELVAQVDLLITRKDKKEALEKLREIAQLLPEERGVLHKLLGLTKKIQLDDPIMHTIEDHIGTIDRAIRSQQLHLRITHVQSLITYNLRGRYKKFREAYETQAQSHKKFRAYLLKKLKPYEKKSKEIMLLRKEESVYLKFFKDIQTLFTIKDIEKLQKKVTELLNVTEQLKGTLLYSYMEKDIKKIKKKLQYIRDHPHESRLQYVLAGAYMVSPGTFELTFLYLVVRYMGKYMTDEKSPVKRGYKTVMNTLRDDQSKYI